MSSHIMKCSEIITSEGGQFVTKRNAVKVIINDNNETLSRDVTKKKCSTTNQRKLSNFEDHE